MGLAPPHHLRISHAAPQEYHLRQLSLAMNRLRTLLGAHQENTRKLFLREVGAYAIKRVAAGAHLPTLWLFEPAKCPDDKADYYLDCSFFPQCKHRVHLFTLEWTPYGWIMVRARPNEYSQWSIYLPKGKTSWLKRVPNTEPLDHGSYALPLRQTGTALFWQHRNPEVYLGLQQQPENVAKADRYLSVHCQLSTHQSKRIVRFLRKHNVFRGIWTSWRWYWHRFKSSDHFQYERYRENSVPLSTIGRLTDVNMTPSNWRHLINAGI